MVQRWSDYHKLMLKLLGHSWFGVRERTGSNRGLGVVHGLQVFVLDHAKLRAVEINRTVDGAAAVFDDEQAGRPYIFGIKARDLGVSDRATENRVEPGLGGDKRFFRGRARCRRILLVAGCKCEEAPCDG